MFFPWAAPPIWGLRYGKSAGRSNEAAETTNSEFKSSCTKTNCHVALNQFKHSLNFSGADKANGEMIKMSIFTRKKIEAKAGEFSDLIDEITLLNAGWEDLLQEFVQFLPGTAFSLIQQNTLAIDRSRSFHAGYADGFVDTFNEHYFDRNPWAHHWNHNPVGRLMVSENDFPSRLLKGTEFYHDWLMAHGDIEAATGIKIYGAEGEVIHMAIHFPLALAEKYNQLTGHFLRQMYPALRRGVAFAQTLRAIDSKARIKAATTSIGDETAFIVDRTLKVREATPKAIAEFKKSELLSLDRGQASFVTSLPETNFKERIELVLGSRDGFNQFGIRNATNSYAVSLFRVPATESATHQILLTSEELALVIVRDLSHPSSQRGFHLLVELFELTPAELRLCERLFQGFSINEAAELNGITRQTARDYLKNIFSKTNTNRQSALMKLMASLR